MSAGWRQLAAATGGALGVAVLASWPLAARLGAVRTSARADGDFGYSLWVQGWGGRVLTGQDSFQNSVMVYFPDGQALATSVWNLVTVLGTGWLQLVLAPLLAWHVSMFLVSVANGVAGWFLGRCLGGSAGAWVAMVAAAAAPFAWTQMAEGRLEQALLAPILMTLLGLEMVRAGAPRGGLLTGAGLGLVAGTYWFMAPLIVVATAPMWVPALRTAAARRSLGLAAVVAAVIVAAFLVPVAPALVDGVQQDAVQSVRLSAIQRGNSALSPWQLVAGGGLPGHRLPVVLVLSLGAGLFFAGGRRWVGFAGVAAALAAGAVLTWDGTPVRIGGWSLALPLAGMDVLPGFRRFWWPNRAAALVTAGGIGCAALAAGQLRARLAGRPRVFGAVVVGALAVLVLDARGIFLDAVSRGDPRVPTSPLDPRPDGRFYAASLPGWVGAPPETGAVLPLPWGRVGNAAPLYQAFHGLPSVLGDGAGERRIRPKTFSARVEANPLLSAWDLGQTPDTAAAAAGFRALEQQGVRWVLWHLPDPDTDPQAASAWRRDARVVERALGPPEVEEPTLLVWSLSSD